jgi:hypothetical protein
MPPYLLSTRCLYNIALQNKNKAQLWFESLVHQGLHFGDFCISAFSIPQIRFYFDHFPPQKPGDRQVQANFYKLVTQFSNAQAIIGCPPEAALYWANTLGEDVMYDEPPPPWDIGTEVLVLATAAVMHNGTRYTLVEREQPLHRKLKLLIHDPY